MQNPRGHLSGAVGAMVATFALRAVAASVVPAPGYIYSAQPLSNLTQGCIAGGPGGTFVGIGPAFVANAESVVLAKESGELRLVASGFNSIGDCAYDPAADVLYVTDNANNADLGLGGSFGAQSGDTLFAVPNASSASGLSAPGLELLPANSVPFAASVAVNAAGHVFVSDSVGGGSGRVLQVVGTTPTTLLSGLDYAAGLAVDPPTGQLYSAQTLASFEARIDRFTAVGTPVPPIPFAGPSYGFGSYDLAFDSDGRLLVTGAYAGDVLAFDVSDGTSAAFASGLTYATGVTTDAFTGRVQILSATFSGAAEDKSLHRFTPIDRLVAGTGAGASNCVQEFFGLDSPTGALSECVDGSACDADGRVNDRCVFPLGFCFNVDDPSIPACSTTNAVTAVQLSTKPYAASAADALAGLSLPMSGSTCVFSDGFVVPLKVAGAGVRKNGVAKLKLTTATNGGQKDVDKMKLVCKPAP